MFYRVEVPCSLLMTVEAPDAETAIEFARQLSERNSGTPVELDDNPGVSFPKESRVWFLNREVIEEGEIEILFNGDSAADVVV